MTTVTDTDPIKVEGVHEAVKELTIQLGRLEDVVDALADRFKAALRPRDDPKTTTFAMNIQWERSWVARDFIVASERIEEKVAVLQDLIDRCDLYQQP